MENLLFLQYLQAAMQSLDNATDDMLLSALAAPDKAAQNHARAIGKELESLREKVRQMHEAY